MVLIVATPITPTEDNSIEGEITPDDVAHKWAPWSQAKISTKQAWTVAEDEKLRELVGTYGAGRWSMIADLLKSNRIGKQCRERWCNHLSPAVKKEGFTADEDRRIVEAIAAHGTKWSAIVRFVPGRTDNAIKNRWNSCIRRMTREQQRLGTCVLGAGDLLASDPAELARQLVAHGLTRLEVAVPAASAANRRLLPDAAAGVARGAAHGCASGAQQQAQGLHLLSHLSVAQEAPSASPQIVAAALSLGGLTSLSSLGGAGAPRPRPRRRKRDATPPLLAAAATTDVLRAAAATATAAAAAAAAADGADAWAAAGADEAAAKRMRSPLQPLARAVSLVTSAEMHDRSELLRSPRTMDAAASLLAAL